MYDHDDRVTMPADLPKNTDTGIKSLKPAEKIKEKIKNT